MIVLTDGSLMFLAAILGEELVFRGYIINKLEAVGGQTKAIILSAGIFALWHIPVYFSLYQGSIAGSGFVALALQIFAHFISAIPLCLLFISTHDLYGVSIIHAALDLIQYEIIGNTALGSASAQALFFFTAMDVTWLTLYSWIGQALCVILMLMAHKWLKSKFKLHHL